MTVLAPAPDAHLDGNGPVESSPRQMIEPESSVWHRSLHSSPQRVTAARGTLLTLAGGRTVIDAVGGGAAVTAVGQAHPRVIAAMQEHLASGVPQYVHTYHFTSEPAEQLADFLVGHRPGGLCRAFFVSSGSEANDGAMKMVRQYHIENNQPERVNFIAREMSYHGNTIGALSLSGHRTRRQPFESMLTSTVGRVPACCTYRGQLNGESDQDYLTRLERIYEAEFQRLGPSTVAAFWAEPVVGASTGCTTAVPGYFPMVRRLCDRHGALLVLDEVMCGMGRTGTLHAWEQEQVTPDIQIVAKGLGGGYVPIAAIMACEKVVDVFVAGSGAFVHGHTYQAMPFACATALAVQRVIVEEKLLENCTIQGKFLGELLQRDILPLKIVGDVRGRGLFWGIEYVSDKVTKQAFPKHLEVSKKVHDRAMEEGVLVFLGNGTVDGSEGNHSMIMPSYNITRETIETIVMKLKIAILAVTETLEGEEVG